LLFLLPRQQGPLGGPLRCRSSSFFLCLVGHFVADCQRHGHWSLMQRLALLQITGVMRFIGFRSNAGGAAAKHEVIRED
jgi:hypothetical protein